MQRPTALSHQETLRTIGAVLDAAGCTSAVLVLTSAGLRVHADVATVREDWSLAALAAEARRQRELRREDAPGSSVPWAKRLGWQLRLVGAALDLVGPGPYTVMARPEEVFVFNARGFRRSFRHTALERRAALAPDFRGQPTTCPVCDEPEALVPLLHHLSDDEVLSGAADASPAQPSHRCRLCGANVRLDTAPRG
ncbi:MAG TPA: hypothetical protein VFE37_12200 [Chloroflexota bacterium]|nr:hypothetical protein [Chloroflexota bacterium]